MLDSPAYNVSEADDVRVDGERLTQRERTRLFLFHKSRGLVTTARDPEGRATIFDALPPDLPRLVAVGRLDINTEGLLLLTNDGGLARVLELPATGWLRRYRVRAHGRIDQATLDSLGDGVTVDGVDYAGIEARLDREQGSNVWITMGLREGKNREIKKVLEHLGLAVNRLIRVSFGPFELGDLAEGEVAEVRTRVLRDQLGAKLAREAGADFDAPIIERAAARPAPGEEEAATPQAGRRRRILGARADRRRAAGEPGRRRRAGSSAAARGPAPSQPERRRKHVSALRAEIAADAAGPRKRIERGATRDRKGRTIAVERISPTGEEARKRAAAVTRGPRRAEGSAAAEATRAARSSRSANRLSGRGGRIRSRSSGRATAKDASGRRGAEHEGRGQRAEFKPRGPRKETRERPAARGTRPADPHGAAPQARRSRRGGRNAPGPPPNGVPRATPRARSAISTDPRASARAAPRAGVRATTAFRRDASGKGPSKGPGEGPAADRAGRRESPERCGSSAAG